MLIGKGTLTFLFSMMPEEVTGMATPELNGRALLFLELATIGTGVAFGLFPALHSTRPDLVTALRNNSGKLAGGRTARRFRTVLATAQIALAMALLAVALVRQEPHQHSSR